MRLISIHFTNEHSFPDDMLAYKCGNIADNLSGQTTVIGALLQTNTAPIISTVPDPIMLQGPNNVTDFVRLIMCP